MRAYRIQLNLLRSQNADAHNMRTFEVPAVGGIMLAEATSDHVRYFEEGKEVFLFRDHDNLIEMARKVLAFSPEQAGKVRERARARCLTSGYSYGERSKTVLDVFKAYLNA
jgi:spore maturation protein CgeB